MAASEVRGDEHAAEYLTGDSADRQRDRVRADGPHPLDTGEVELDAGQRLGEHERRSGALDDAGADQDARIWGQPAHKRRQTERRDAGQEHPAIPVGLTETGAGNQQHRERHEVARDDKLKRGARSPKMSLNRRRRHIRDRRVRLRHERAHEQDGQQAALGKPGGSGCCAR